MRLRSSYLGYDTDIVTNIGTTFLAHYDTALDDLFNGGTELWGTVYSQVFYRELQGVADMVFRVPFTPDPPFSSGADGVGMRGSGAGAGGQRRKHACRLRT